MRNVIALVCILGIGLLFGVMVIASSLRKDRFNAAAAARAPVVARRSAKAEQAEAMANSVGADTCAEMDALIKNPYYEPGDAGKDIIARCLMLRERTMNRIAWDGALDLMDKQAGIVR